MATQRGLPVNFRRALIGLLDSNGYAIGVNPTLANGQGSGAYVFNYVKDAPYANANREIRQQTGGGISIGHVTVSDAPMQGFDMQVADVDPTGLSVPTGAAVDSTGNSLRPRHMLNSALVELPDAFAVFQQEFRSPSRAGGSTKRYAIDFFPRCQISPIRNGPAERDFSTMRYRIEPSYTDKDITGEAFAAGSGMKPSDGLLDFYTYESNYPVHVYTYKRSTVSSGETFTLPYLPASNVVTVNATENDAWKNGTRTALTSVSTTTAEVALPAGTIGDIWVVIYGTLFIASS